jgi:Protein of unknown function, DUF481
MSELPWIYVSKGRGWMARGVLNRRRMNKPSCLVAVCLSIPTIVLAQPAPTFQAGKAEDVKDVKEVTWVAKGEAGLLSTTGNSRSTTITAGGSASRKDKDNKFEATLAAAYARATTRTANDANNDGTIAANELSDTRTTAVKNAAVKLRYDRYLTELDSFYVAALGAIDKPAGKTFQGGGQLGYSRSLYKDDDQQVLSELGYDLSYLSLESGASTTIHSGRAFVGYKNQLKKDTALEASAEGLFNANTLTFGMRQASAFQATRLNGLVSITTALSTKISLSASFTAKYDNFPAPLAAIGPLPFAAGFEPSSEKLDTITKVSLIVNFL